MAVRMQRSTVYFDFVSQAKSNDTHKVDFFLLYTIKYILKTSDETNIFYLV